MAENKRILDIQVNVGDAVNNIMELEYSIDSLKRKMAGLLKDRKVRDLNEDERKTYEELSQTVKVYQQQIQGYTKQIRNQIKAQEENEGSLVSLRAQLSNLNKEYDNLSEVDRNSELGESLLKTIQEVNKELLTAEERTGRFQRNVGNYYGSIMNAAQDLLGGLDGGGPLGGGVDSGMGAGGDALKKQKKDIETLRVRLKLLGQDGTEVYQQLTEAAGTLEDTIADATAETRHLASDTARLDELREGFDATGDAVSSVCDAMDVLGTESDALEAIQGKLSKSTSVINSLRSVQNSLQKQSALMMGIQRIQTLAAIKAQNMLAAAEGKATIAQRIFNAVAKANPYVLLAGAVMTVVGALAAFVIGTDKAKSSQDKLNKSIAEFEKTQARIDKMRKEQDYDTEVEEQKSLTPVEKQTLKIKQLNKLEGVLEKSRDEAQRALDAVKKEYEKDAEEYQKALEHFEKANEAYLDTRSQREEASKEGMSLAMKEQSQIEEEARKDRAEKEAEDAKDRLEKQKDMLKKQLDEQRRAQDLTIANIKDANERARQEETANYSRQIEDLKQRLKEETDLTANAKKAIKDQIEQLTIAQSRALMQIEQNAAKERLEKAKADYELELESVKEESQTALDLKLKALGAERDIELSNTELTERQKYLIKKKYEKLTADEQAEFLKSQQEKNEEAYKRAQEIEMAQLIVSGANELKVLEMKAKQAADAFAQMTQKEGETNEEYQLRLLQQQQEAVESEKELKDKRKEIADQTTESYSQIASSIGDVTEAIAEGTKADKSAKKISAGLGLVTSGVALAKGIEKAMEQSWPMNLAALASTVASLVPIISNVKTLAGYATGGYIQGAGNGKSDSIVARVSNGEAVMTAASVSAYSPLLSALNQSVGGAPINTGAEVSNNNYIAQQMALALRSMPAPQVSVVDINKGQNRVSVIENSSKMF